MTLLPVQGHYSWRWLIESARANDTIFVSGYFPTKQQMLKTQSASKRIGAHHLTMPFRENTLLFTPYHKNDEGTAIRQFDYVVSNPPFKMDFSDNTRKIAAQPCTILDMVVILQMFRAKKKGEHGNLHMLHPAYNINSSKKERQRCYRHSDRLHYLRQVSMRIKSSNTLLTTRLSYGVVSMLQTFFANTGTSGVSPFL